MVYVTPIPELGGHYRSLFFWHHDWQCVNHPGRVYSVFLVCMCLSEGETLKERKSAGDQGGNPKSEPRPAVAAL